MSLNDDALSDLPKPDENIASILLTTTPDSKMRETVPPSPEANDYLGLISKTNDVKVKFKELETGSTKALDMKDLMEEVSTAGKISRSDADTVNTAFEGFYNAVSPLEFTRIPTGTNLKFSLSYMSKTLKAAMESIHGDFNAFFQQPLNDVEAIADRIEQQHLPAIEKALTCAIAQRNELTEKIATNKNLIIPYKDGFVDLRQLALQDIEIDKYTIDHFDARRFATALKNFQELWKGYGIFRSLLIGVLDKKSIDEITSNDGMISTITRSTTIGELCDIFTLPALLDYVKQLYAKTRAALDMGKSLREAAAELPNDSEKWHNFLVDNSADIGEMVSCAHALSEATATLLHVFPSVETILETYATV